MTSKDSKAIVLAFNDCINNRDIDGLSDLMTEGHTFIDRDGKSYGPRSFMVPGWKDFFKSFPDYRNTFTRIEATDDHVTALGHAYWNEEEPYDPVIWTARVEEQKIADWRIYEDSKENRIMLNLN